MNVPRVSKVLTMDMPYSTVHMTENNFVDHVSMRAAALAEVLRLMHADEPENFMTSLCLRLVGDLRNASDDIPRSLLAAKQLAEILLQEQGNEGLDDLLWLCQQMAEEMRAVLGVMAGNAAEREAA